MKAPQKGFTLVEIAIVLVIIGLLLGGILKGQEMIVQAKIKNVIADLSGISAAYHGYQDRYRAIPGDDRNSNRWGLVPPGTAGDGVVGGTYNAACASTATDESCLWWDHLRRAGFVAGSGQVQPANAVGGIVGVQNGNGNATTPGPAMGALYTLIVCSANLPDKIVIAVDNQMDDGNAPSGSLRAQIHDAINGVGPNPNIIGGAPGANYVESGTNLYTACRTL